MAFPFFPEGQEVTKEKLLYLHQVRDELQRRRKLHDQKGPFFQDVTGEQHPNFQQEHRKKTRAFALLKKPLKKTSQEGLSASSQGSTTLSANWPIRSDSVVKLDPLVRSMAETAEPKVLAMGGQETKEIQDFEWDWEYLEEGELRGDIECRRQELKPYFSAPGWPSDNHEEPQVQLLPKPPSRRPKPTSLETKGFQMPLSFPATEIFRRCSQAFTNPFAPGFDIDPTKLNWSSPFLCDIDAEQPWFRELREHPLRVLDVGGGVCDDFVSRLSFFPRVRVCKVVRKSGYSQSQQTASTHRGDVRVLAVASLAKLPFATESVDVIIARSLYKNITIQATSYLSEMDTPLSTAARSRYETELCLRQFFRILSKGGRFEYIYFDKSLHNAEPLTAKMEPFIYGAASHDDFGANTPSQDAPENENRGSTDVPTFSYPGFHEGWMSSSPTGGSCQPNDLTADEFLSLVEAVGFTQVRNTELMFPVVTLSDLFTPEGLRRQTTPSVDCQVRSVDQDGEVYRLGCAAAELLKKVRKECRESETAWKCIIGWAQKT